VHPHGNPPDIPAKTRDEIMTNDMTPYDAHNDGWEDAAKDAASTVIRGSILKFADWRWTHGQDGMQLDDGTRLLAVGTAAAWVKWQGGKPVEYRLRRPGEDLPEREELGDNVAANWELGPDSQPRDPWQSTRFVYLLGENAEAYTFSTSSWGGRNAAIELADQIQRMRFARPGAVPVVELHAAPMQTKFGKKSKPIFKVVDWRYPDGNETKALAHEPARNADMQDELPF
jgi:hypothetical protein